MFQFGKLRLNVVPFLYVSVCSVLKCLDDYLFASFSGKYDERSLVSFSPKYSEKINARHAGHLIV